MLAVIGAGALAVLAVVSDVFTASNVPGWASDVAHWFYPLPLIVLLALGLVAAVLVPRAARRRTPTYRVEQEQLDRILRVLPRKPIRELEHTDFTVGWSEAWSYPVGRYWEEHHEVEDASLTRSWSGCALGYSMRPRTSTSTRQ